MVVTVQKIIDFVRYLGFFETDCEIVHLIECFTQTHHTGCNISHLPHWQKASMDITVLFWDTKVLFLDVYEKKIKHSL